MAQANKPDKLKFFLFFLSLVLLWYLGWHFSIDSNSIKAFLAKFPLILSGLLFVLLYVVITFFIWLSKDILRLLAALLFGVYLSSILVWLAEIVNACVLFYLARYLGRDFVERYQPKSFQGFDQRLSGANFFWLFMFRAAPVIPFRFLDLSMGLTGIKFRKYLMVVLFGSPLRILWLQYIFVGLGQAALGDPRVVSGYLLAHGKIFVVSLIYFILVMVVLVKIKHKE